MKRNFKPARLTPGLVISVVAVFFAIGGIGYAAGKIGTDDIKSDAVTKSKIADDSVNSARIQDGTIKYKDLKFSPDSLVGPEGPQGPQGPEGPEGPPGPANVQADSQAKIATAEASPTLDNGAIVPLAVNEGMAWAAVCKAGASGTPGTGAILVVQNLSAGDNSHINGALTFQDATGAPIGPDQSNDFDVGEVAILADSFVDNTMSRAGYGANTPAGGAAFGDSNRGANVVIFGNDGNTQSGIGGAVRAPAGYPGSPACVVSLNLLAK